MNLETARLDSTLDVKQPNRPIVVPKRQARTVRRERKAPIRAPIKPMNFPKSPCLQPPDRRGCDPSHGEIAAIRGITGRQPRLPLENHPGHDRLTPHQLIRRPEFHLPVRATGKHRPPIGRERDSLDPLASVVTIDGLDLRGGSIQIGQGYECRRNRDGGQQKPQLPDRPPPANPLWPGPIGTTGQRTRRPGLPIASDHPPAPSVQMFSIGSSGNNSAPIPRRRKSPAFEAHSVEPSRRRPSPGDAQE